MNKQTIITALLVLASATVTAQTKVTGCIMNERGEAVEYATVALTLANDSIVRAVIGKITVPSGCEADMRRNK